MGHVKKTCELVYLPSDHFSQFSPAIAILLNPERFGGADMPTYTSINLNILATLPKTAITKGILLPAVSAASPVKK